MARYLILVIGILTAFRAFGADSYLCVTDLLTGFAFDSDRKAWKRTHFQAQEKFIISRASNQKYAWTVTVVGESRPHGYCEVDFSKAGILFCKGVYFDIHLNNKSLRFLYVHYIGYWDEGVMKDIFPDMKEGDNTPAMGIGKCSPI